ncbi:uncharacterized protein LOC134238279 isoform X5 [Saccostrea cucullata]|uniref:uncharacterized protein LOC134238279 isoform X5 n=1 Tax=Saccostrea cuccullata TaxID=36930 RepID=UPI002ED15DD4
MYGDQPTYCEPTPTVVAPPRPASAQSFTPAYLWSDFEPPGVRRERTTYGNMNDWMKVSRNGVPVTMSDNNWHNLKKSEQKEHDLQFKKAFSNLTNKIAYRYPNPGNPRQRQGRIGGSWRHIKEVLGHGGSRVVYVDDPPVQPASPSYQGGDVARKMGLNVSPKYKGFYRYGAN